MLGVTAEAGIFLIVTGNPAQTSFSEKEYLVALGMLKTRSSNCHRIYFSLAIIPASQILFLCSDSLCISLVLFYFMWETCCQQFWEKISPSHPWAK